MEKLFKDLAKYENEPTIETYKKNHDTLFAVIFVVVIIGFISGEIIIRTL